MNTEPSGSRLERQIEFILEIDKLKQVFRQTYLLDRSRKENDAEHSWHLAMLAILFAEYATEPDIDVQRVVKMVLIHDLVEIDAGDTFRYDEEGAKTKQKRELAAADRIFNILPPDQAAEIRALWDEFEAMDTPESRYAAAIDRLQPLLHNLSTEGITWREQGVTADMVLDKNSLVAAGTPQLWEYVKTLIHEAVEKGHLKAR